MSVFKFLPRDEQRVVSDEATRLDVPRGTPRELREGWELAVVPSSASADVSFLDDPKLSWTPAPVPGTVAGALRQAGTLDLERPPFRLDGSVVWYRLRFAADGPDAAGAARSWLSCDGLATVADVWLNGVSLGRTDNMFRAYRWDVTRLVARENELLLRFEALDKLLAARRPRPRWRVPMVEHQQLRFWRTTLLGRTPGWSPPVPPVGPWRRVALTTETPSDSLHEERIEARVVRGEGSEHLDGLLRVSFAWSPPPGEKVEDLRIELAHGQQRTSVALVRADAEVEPVHDGAPRPSRWTGELRIPSVALWWPFTHGTPALYDLTVVAKLAGQAVARRWRGPRVGFREVKAETSDGGFALVVNGARVFARGACWTPDPVLLATNRDELRRVLGRLVDAGLNMVRVGGTMVYESDDFYDLCDELGLLVWQDFMFANMDYPDADAAFLENARVEVSQFLARMQGRPSLAVLCGDSEGEQQAAMWGAPRESWARPFFRETLRAWASEGRPDVPYWPSSASGGAFPHQPSQGTASYYGVGAYLRPLDDARASGVRFASECLAFANVPETATLEAWGNGTVPRVHTPAWKTRTPRDLGAGWDFDDVRDHYVSRLFGLDPATLRYADHERYLDLGRVAVGETMAATFGAWRRGDSVCAGGLVWFLRDLWPGAGWGLLDASGLPKSVYHFVRRACAPLAVHLSDEGLNGYRLDVAHDGGADFTGELRIDLYRAGDVHVGSGRRELRLRPREGWWGNVVDLLAGFQDLTFAYRFGPPVCDVVVASVHDAAGQLVSQDFAFPSGRPATRERDVGILAEGTVVGDGVYRLVLEARRFAFAVVLEVAGSGPGSSWDFDDLYFHLAPGVRRVVTVRARGHAPATPPRVNVRAMNAELAARVSWA